MKKALVHSGRICEVREDEFPVAKPMFWVDVPDDTTVEDTYENGVVVKYSPGPIPRQTQPVVTMRQARLALLQAGKLADVDAVIAQAGDAARIEWEYAQELRRDHPLVTAMGAALGMSVEQIDALFEQAALL
jgi:hypothetical protein